MADWSAPYDSNSANWIGACVTAAQEPGMAPSNQYANYAQYAQQASRGNRGKRWYGQELKLKARATE